MTEVTFRGRLGIARRSYAALSTRLARRARHRERRQRAGFVENASRVTPHVAVERDGAVFFLPIRQKDGADRFAKQEWKEHRHLQRALEVLEEIGADVPRKTFVDVGAHIGTTTITAIRRFSFEAAIAFEPEPLNFRLLRANVGVNDLEATIRTFNVAVSDQAGDAVLALRPEIGSKHRLLAWDEAAAETVPVTLTTLDTLVDDGRLDPAQTSLLWLDVEGHELEVLRGARQLVERSVPIVMEFAPGRLAQDRGRLAQDSRLASMFALLEQHYTHLLDLRSRSCGAEEIQPVAALPELAERYLGDFTDLLVFRRPAGTSRRAA
jgi:FkbM family methyltransferase